MEFIFHVADAATWEAAKAAGHYDQSTLDKSIAEEGFMHCSYKDQVSGVAQRYYAEVTSPLVLLTIDPSLLDAPLMAESPAEGAEPYPHIYGILNVNAVIEVAPFHA